jgi:sialate O-acetylesterase
MVRNKYWGKLVICCTFSLTSRLVTIATVILQRSRDMTMHISRFNWVFLVCLLQATSCSVVMDNTGMSNKPFPKNTDIWVLAGQSNMMPYGMVEEPVVLDPGRVMNFRLDYQWHPAHEPLGWYHESVDPVHRNLHIQGGGKAEDFDRASRTPRPELVGGVGVGTGFAKRIIDHLDVNIGLIPCAHGGTYMYQWDPALRDEGGASLYGSMMKRIAATGGKIKGILWYQGENESSDYYADRYEDAMLNLIDSIRRDVGDPDLPFIYVQLGCFYLVPPENYNAWEKVREIQRRVALQRKNVHVVSAIDLPIGDGMHLPAGSAQRVGWRLAEVALSEVYKMAGHGRSINLESIKYSKEERTIKLHFSGVTGRLHALGRPADFQLRVENHHTYSPVCYRTDFDPDDPAGLILHLGGQLDEPFRLVYGSGPTPYCNIVDDRDIPVPAFGPVEIPEN